MGIHRLPTLDESPKYHIYALLCQDEDGPGYIKFGMSGNVTSRLSSLRTACPIPARFIATVDVGYDRDRCLRIEKDFHRHFEDRKVKAKGEWFRFNFSDPDDKRAFNEGSQLILVSHFGQKHPWWEKISVKALDEYNRKRQMEFLNSPHRRKIERRANAEAARKRAWKELA